MKHDVTQISSPVAHAEFSADGALLSASPGFLSDGLSEVEGYLRQFDLIDGQPATDAVRREAAERWKAPDAAIL